MAGELAVVLAEGGSHRAFRDVREPGADLGCGQELGIGHAERMMLVDGCLQAVDEARLVRHEEIAGVAETDVVVRDADDLGEVLEDGECSPGPARTSPVR